MTVAEAEDEYLKAVRLGQKECAVLQGKGQNPFPVVLDQILGDGVSEGAQNVTPSSVSTYVMSATQS